MNGWRDNYPLITLVWRKKCANDFLKFGFREKKSHVKNQAKPSEAKQARKLRKAQLRQNKISNKKFFSTRLKFFFIFYLGFECFGDVLGWQKPTSSSLEWNTGPGEREVNQRIERNFGRSFQVVTKVETFDIFPAF